MFELFLIINIAVLYHDNYEYYWDVYVHCCSFWITDLRFLKLDNLCSAIAHQLDVSAP